MILSKWRHVVVIWGMMVVAGCAPTLVGVLKDDDGKLVTSSSAAVNISSLEGDATVILPVDQSGRFEVRDDLPPGEYLVEALVPGYDVKSERVRIGETKSVELTLRPVRKPKPSAIDANVDGEVNRGAGGASLTPPQL